MSFLELVLLALGLAMDATAVAISTGFAASRVRLGDAALVALFFGGFQAGMPAIGGFAGERVAGFVTAWADWIAAAVLVGIGGHMIWEALGKHEEKARRDPFHVGVLAALAVATSIDAFAAGIALPLLGVELLPAVALIGGVTAALSFAGVYLGRRFGDRLGRRLDVVGGLALVAIAVRIVVARLAR